MASLTFVGAAGTVTGSKHLVTDGERRFFIDCGLFQGPPEIEALNHVPLPVAPKALDAVVITHGHLDHVGYLPKLVRDGYRGPIYCTPATAEVAEIVLEDAAHVQEDMHERGFQHERSSNVAPFFTDDDVAAALRLLQTVDLETDFDVCGSVLRYHDSGHILGAASVDARIGGRRAIFSGDLGRYDAALLHDPTALDDADIILCEATYGDRVHPPDSLGALGAALRAGIQRGGPIVIPAFAVEGVQDLLYAIGRLQESDRAIAPIAVHLDSPMAIKVDAVFARHREGLKIAPGDPSAPFGCRNLTTHVTTEESKTLNRLTGPCIIIASSGMATGGRVLYHLHNNLSNPQATIIFPGYQVAGTLGRLITDGVTPVRIFGDRLAVRATIVHLSAFSAHAGQDELLRWLGTLRVKHAHVYVVHADPAAAAVFAPLVRERLGLAATVAQRGMTVTM